MDNTDYILETKEGCIILIIFLKKGSLDNTDCILETKAGCTLLIVFLKQRQDG